MIKFIDSTISESKKLIGKKNIFPKDIYIEKIENNKMYYEIKKGEKYIKFFTSDFTLIIFNHIKKIIKEYNNNKEIKKAIIAVPKHFNQLQINEIKKSAEKVGFEIIKTINESYAAAIGYADIIKSDKEKKVLIFDLGSAFLNISIVKIKQIQCQEIISSSFENLGGIYFTQRLMDYIMNENKKDEKFKNIDYKNKKDKKILRALMKIKLESENVKLKLSTDTDVNYFIEELNGEDDFNLKIEKDKFEDLCKDLWDECLNKVKETIEKSKLKIENIDEIILVGGSTRIPKIQEMLENYFKKKPLQNVNADEIVAQGAAIA
jgi:molecular chaperone DnaK (HSP70)